MAMNLPPTQAGENAALTKPGDWSLHMVTAALKFASDEKTSTGYTIADEARLDILNTLNWYEAHAEYEWPDFSKSGFDFAQTMRLRRALVNDVYLALQKAGNIRITGQPGVLGTPESGRSSAKRTRTSSRQLLTGRKRRCKREEGSDTNIDEDKPFWDDEEFLASTMRSMITNSGADVDSYLNGEMDADSLEAIVHDGLVGVWNKPVATYGIVPQELERKQEAWATRRRSLALESSPELGARHAGPERERTKMTSTPLCL
ncbi:hypothetical protein P153DRAFT_380969 [Dothidotthia symphoricarpi CBS 119687]|uniref:Uncharacterized protein n=1 Tax=Dothidotthia symphoricarpi CBS 119687 TaxID=1392245 RepID=A0A6A6ATB5_9PLEO|nr:uncharacterized protein P153DRAFT_380969 [Dothidotthia symphoricarpi CBS 119687]KAF2133791.1 hypothetical protein P153DRAFT_380969 [Dothidotthia symphoricarpi CBS 119687]